MGVTPTFRVTDLMTDNDVMARMVGIRADRVADTPTLRMTHMTRLRVSRIGAVGMDTIVLHLPLQQGRSAPGLIVSAFLLELLPSTQIWARNQARLYSFCTYPALKNRSQHVQNFGVERIVEIEHKRDGMILAHGPALLVIPVAIPRLDNRRIAF